MVVGGREVVLVLVRVKAYACLPSHAAQPARPQRRAHHLNRIFSYPVLPEHLQAYTAQHAHQLGHILRGSADATKSEFKPCRCLQEAGGPALACSVTDMVSCCCTPCAHLDAF